jgi:hypothetical protein
MMQQHDDAVYLFLSPLNSIMLVAILSRSQQKYKKYRMQFIDVSDFIRTGKIKIIKTTHFGDNRYDDFTTHHDPIRQQKYLSRHRNDPHEFYTAGELSRTILWSSPQFDIAVKNYKQKHGIHVVCIDLDTATVSNSNSSISSKNN